MKKIGLFYAAKAEKTSWVAEKIQQEFGERQDSGSTDRTSLAE